MKEKIKKHKKAWIILAIVIVVAITVLILVTKSGRHAKQNKEGEVRQNTISLEKMDLTKSVSATGTITSCDTKMVSVDINGIEVKTVPVSVGDSVKKGDVLVTFDKTDLLESLEEAQENLSDAKEEGNRNITSAQKQYQDAKETYEDEKESLAEKVSDAKKELTEKKKQVNSAKDGADKEKAEEALNQAESAYENAVSNRKTTNKQNKEKMESAKDSIETARSNKEKSVKEASKQVEEAQKTLDKCSVTAPISGVITACGVEEGDMYSGGTMFQIEDTSAYTVSTTVDEYDISKLEKGQRVVLLTEATDEDELEGEISFVAPSTSSTSLSSGSSQSGESGMGTSSSGGYEIIININTKDERLKMGLTAKCSIILEEAVDVFAVPYDAVHENSDGTSVIYVSEGEGTSLSKREVQVTKGMESDYYVEISGDELTEGMNVQIPTDETSEKTSDSDSKQSDFSMMGGGDMPGGGQMPDSGTRGGGNRGGGGNNGRHGM